MAFVAATSPYPSKKARITAERVAAKVAIVTMRIVTKGVFLSRTIGMMPRYADKMALTRELNAFKILFGRSSEQTSAMHGRVMAQTKQGVAIGHKKLPISLLRTHVDLKETAISRWDSAKCVLARMKHAEE